MRTTLAADSPSLLRQLNTTVVLEVIRKTGPISRPQLAREAGLSNPTVAHVVDQLLALGYVLETEASSDEIPRRRGPKAKLLTFHATLGYVLGIDAGADNSVVKLADLSGAVVAQGRAEHPRSARASDVLAAIRSTVADVLERGGVASGALHAISVGTPGVVDPLTGTISLAPQIEGWDGLNLAVELSDLAACRIVVDNECHLALLAEQWRGGAGDAENVLLVQLGVGIGGAVLIDGKLFRGSTGAAGEIAYMQIGGDNEDVPPEGSVGAFEWFAGGRAYRRHGMAAASEPEGQVLLELAHGDPSAIDARIVFAAAAQGDPVAAGITTTLLGRLGRGVATIAATFNPELILVGGGIADAGEAVLGPIRDGVGRFTPHPTTIRLSTLGSDATALGAVRRAMEIADELSFSFITEPMKEVLPA
ncbi:MAG: ROK family protein [Rhodoglobus sp.]